MENTIDVEGRRALDMDLPLRDVDDAWDRLQQVQTVYGVQLKSLIG